MVTELTNEVDVEPAGEDDGDEGDDDDALQSTDRKPKPGNFCSLFLCHFIAGLPSHLHWAGDIHNLSSSPAHPRKVNYHPPMMTVLAILLLAGIEVRHYAPVWFTGTSLVVWSRENALRDTIGPKNQRGIHERWTRHTTDVGLSRKFAETFNFDLSLGVCIQRLCKPLIIQKKMFGGWCFAPEPYYRGASMGDSLVSEEPTTLKHLRMHKNPISTRYFISCIWGKSLKLLRTDVVF